MIDFIVVHLVSTDLFLWYRYSIFFSYETWIFISIFIIKLSILYSELYTIENELFLLPYVYYNCTYICLIFFFLITALWRRCWWALYPTHEKSSKTGKTRFLRWYKKICWGRMGNSRARLRGKFFWIL
jgi:hypothetical protein